MGVDQFTQYLEEGSITPGISLEHNGFDDGRDYLYILVWNGMALEGGRTFEDLVRDHGMSVDEPNDIIVVTKECVSENEIFQRSCRMRGP